MSGGPLYDHVRRPVKLTTDGWMRYGPVSDVMEKMDDGNVEKLGWLPYVGLHTDNPKLATGWYHVDDADEIKRVLRRETDWYYMRALGVTGDILDVFAEAERSGYIEVYGKRIPLPGDLITWEDRVGFWLANFGPIGEK